MRTSFALWGMALPVYAVVHESLAILPYSWTESSTSISDDAYIALSVMLPYSNVDKLEPMLQAVSEPSSPQYGEYIDMADIDAIFGAPADSADAVVSWLGQSGATNIVNNGNVVSFTATVGQANRLLDTTFKVYTDGTTEKLRTTSYSVPDELREHIDFISPTTYFGNTKANRAIAPVLSNEVAKRDLPADCSRIWTRVFNGTTYNRVLIGPECLKALYNIGDYQVDVSAGSTIAFASFLGQSASYDDLAIFEQSYNLASQNLTLLALINGGVDNQDLETIMDGEANLDAQNIIGLVDGLRVGQYITGGLAEIIPDLQQPNQSVANNEPYLEYFQYLFSQQNSELPYVLSHSYGDHENTVPIPYAKRVCNMIGMMGLRGRSILFASGDQGVGAVCLNNEPPGLPEFEPNFPCSCPWATSVGGTVSLAPEVAWNYTGGGFSRYFKRPWYQQNAINTYLSSYITPETQEYYQSNNYTDFGGRGYPDVAAHSGYPWYMTIIGGVDRTNGGTSAATPVVASVLALINDARFRAGRPAVGFVNPWLYSAPDILMDVTEGQALGCNQFDGQSELDVPGGGIIPYATWNATVGWDPTTGLGVPDFMKMKDWTPSQGGGNPGGWGNWGSWSNWTGWENWGPP